jgi:hypothetical protein
VRRKEDVTTQRRARLGRRPGNRDTRGEILSAAQNAFAEGGLSGVSLRGIAMDAGVDVALIHHYFHSKEELFLATMLFGDIGTSPIYTVQTIFNPGDPQPVAARTKSVHGLLSLDFGR